MQLLFCLIVCWLFSAMVVVKEFATTARGTTVLTWQELKERLDHEQQRTNRNGSMYSLVAFRSASHTELLEALASNLTAIDTPGYLPDGRLAILLPDIDVTEADGIGKKILSDCTNVRETARFEVLQSSDDSQCRE